MRRTDPLDALLDRLNGGDAEAAAQVFVACEPYLRMVVRRQLPSRLRPKFDSVDVVQSVWADLLEGFRSSGWHFTDAAHLRAFLVKVTRNRFIDRLRQLRQSAEHEEPLFESHERKRAVAPDPRPSEVAQAQDLWQQLLGLCPEGHREVLRLKREGLALDEIARRTGLHPSSIRRILYDLAHRLAERRRAETAAARSKM
jgi:RNA polymerase sigma-70 factor (ECF subfamily)